MSNRLLHFPIIFYLFVASYYVVVVIDRWTLVKHLETIYASMLIYFYMSSTFNKQTQQQLHRHGFLFKI